MRDYNAIDIFSNPMSVEDMNDALLGPQTDISQYIQPDDRDLLDKTVEGYEEVVPLPAQILAGFTLPGMAMDIAAAGKYGRDSFGNFKEGEILPGLGNLGIAALSGLAAVPLFGELANLAKQPLKKGVASLANNNPRYQITRHQEDLYTGNPLGDANKMYDRAVRLAPEFNQQIDDIAKSLNLETTLPEMTTKIDAATLQKLGTVKKIPRMVEKSRLKYDKDVTQLTDPLRTRIVINTPAEEEAVVNILKNKYKLFDKGRDIKPEGFVDRKLNIQFTGSNGENLVAEVGVITAPMWRASDEAHVLYEEFRSLFPKGMPTDPKELQTISRDIRLKGEALSKGMDDVFKNARNQIDPDFYFTGKGITGLHGSPAKFDKFDMSKEPLDEFGLPKGLDRYGRGHYFTTRNKEGKNTVANYAGEDGFVYKVEVPSDKLLRVAEPLSRQHPTLRKKLKEILPDDFVKTDPTGSDINFFIENGPIAKSFNDPNGVKFAAWGSPKKVPYGGKLYGEINGSGNMVVPDDSIIKVTKRSSKTEVKKFASGGYVAAGSSGRSAPMTPNVFSNASLDIFEPSTKKSATWLGSASVQSDLPGDIKYPRSPSPTGANTAGPSSHAKYNVSNFSINSSLQKFTKNYNPNDVDIFEVE